MAQCLGAQMSGCPNVWAAKVLSGKISGVLMLGVQMLGLQMSVNLAWGCKSNGGTWVLEVLGAKGTGALWVNGLTRYLGEGAAERRGSPPSPPSSPLFPTFSLNLVTTFFRRTTWAEEGKT